MKSDTSSIINRHLCLLAVTVLVVFSQVAFCGTYGGGSGTAEEPFLISSADHLHEVGANSGDWGKHFLLIADINLEGFSYNSALIAPDTDDSNYSFEGTPFTGTFDGDGHVISNLTINTEQNGLNYPNIYSNYIGIFGKISGSNAEVKNLGIKNFNIISGITSATGFNYVGGLAGSNESGTVSNCFVTGNISSNNTAGGLIGHNAGIVTECYAVCSISGNITLGGLVGHNEGAIVRSFALASLTGSYYIGGLTGANQGVLLNSYAAGEVSSRWSAGGLVGYDSHGSITNCYSACSVKGMFYDGGLIGQANQESYTGNVWDSDINLCEKSIGNRNNTADVSGKTTLAMQTQSTFISEGWDFVGESDNGTEDIWYMPGCGYPVLSWQVLGTVPDVTGLTEPEAMNLLISSGAVVMKKSVHSKVLPAGMIVSQWPASGCESDVVRIFVSDGFPFEDGAGTEDSPYEIWTAEQMNSIGLHLDDWSDHFVLMEDIDLSAFSGSSYNIIGQRNYGFMGIFDGNEHTVSNLTYSTSEKTGIGLFGWVDLSGQVKDLSLKNINLDCENSDSVGGLIGISEGTISNCSVEGSVRGRYFVGLLLGDNYESITNCFARGSVNGLGYVGGLTGYSGGYLSNCFATGSVIGDEEAGGLIGANEGYVTNSYCLSNVSGIESVGGLVGQNNSGDINNCYAVGTVSGDINVGGIIGGNYLDFGSFNNSFWNAELNASLTGIGNLDDPAGIMGRSTVDMQTAGTFIGAGWDFVGEGVNGVEDVWRMCEDGAGYPGLAWELGSGGDFVCPDGVGTEDIGYLAERWLTAGTIADLNGDGVVNMLDYTLFAQHWLED